MPNGSKPLSFSIADLWPTIKLFLLMILPQILEAITQFIAQQDFGQWSTLVASAWAAVVAFAAKYLPDTRAKP